MRFPSERIAQAIEAGLPQRRPAYTGSEPCASIGSDVYIYDETQPPRRTKEIMRVACNECPLVQECFTWALYRERYYFYAATTAKDREIIRRKHKIRLVSPDA